MSRKKQIEEMANILVNGCKMGGCEECKYSEGKFPECALKYTADQLYNAGYRKQVEGEWIAKDNFNGRCTIATCSKCGVEKAFPVLVRIETISTLYPYCQKCGAKMKGGAE